MPLDGWGKHRDAEARRREQDDLMVYYQSSGMGPYGTEHDGTYEPPFEGRIAYTPNGTAYVEPETIRELYPEETVTGKPGWEKRRDIDPEARRILKAKLGAKNRKI